MGTSTTGPPLAQHPSVFTTHDTQHVLNVFNIGEALRLHAHYGTNVINVYGYEAISDMLA